MELNAIRFCQAMAEKACYPIGCAAKALVDFLTEQEITYGDPDFSWTKNDAEELAEQLLFE